MGLVVLRSARQHRLQALAASHIANSTSQCHIAVLWPYCLVAMPLDYQQAAPLLGDGTLKFVGGLVLGYCIRAFGPSLLRKVLDWCSTGLVPSLLRKVLTSTVHSLLCLHCTMCTLLHQLLCLQNSMQHLIDS